MTTLFARLAGIALVATFSSAAFAGPYKDCLRNARGATTEITACALEYSAQLSLAAEHYLRIAEKSGVLHINDEAWFENTEARCNHTFGTESENPRQTMKMAKCLANSYTKSVNDLIQNLKDLKVIK